ncbi:MAG: heavy-metal-associated domain-containing protein, partial [Candidatus Hydrogenedentes bacterium]|nr:heavy-metal-associated domain-containing protein [Candidatus Hydrogenedentota bacterium]
PRAAKVPPAPSSRRSCNTCRCWPATSLRTGVCSAPPGRACSRSGTLSPSRDCCSDWSTIAPGRPDSKRWLRSSASASVRRGNGPIGQRCSRSWVSDDCRNAEGSAVRRRAVAPEFLGADHGNRGLDGPGTALGMDTTTLDIRGMTCAGCVRRIERTLGQVDGVASAQVNLATNQARIAFDPVRVRASDLVTSIEALGFGVAVPAVAGSKVLGVVPPDE